MADAWSSRKKPPPLPHPEAVRLYRTEERRDRANRKQRTRTARRRPR